MIADVIYINGNIYTVADNFSKGSIIATRGDRIVYVGSDKDEAGKITAAATKVVDLNGKTVIPGLIEGHMHFRDEGEMSLNINTYKLSKRQIIGLVKEKAELLKPGEWIKGSGWNHMDWLDKSWPSKEELDAVAPDHPVMLNRTDMHSLWVNTKALEVAGITKGTPDPQGGEIIKRDNGELLGILVDTARDAIFDVVPPLSDEMKLKAYRLAQEECFLYGLTSIFDAGSTFEDINLLKKAYESGELRLRCYETLISLDGSDIKYMEAGFGPVKGLYDNRLSVNGVKIYADGSIGSRSALFFEDYTDRPGHKGNGTYTDEELYKIVSRVAKNGFQVATHAIGDAAVRQVMDTYERVYKEQGLHDARFRIEHFQIPTPSDVPRSVKLGVVTCLQAASSVTDMNMMFDRLGPERLKTPYVWRQLIDAGGFIAGGSDANVDYLNPYYGIYAGTAMRNNSGYPEDDRYKSHCMTREESLKSFTIWAAKGQFEEDIKGSLEIGKLADFVVIDRDIMTCYKPDIRETQVLLTILGGETVYERNTADFSLTFMGVPVKCGVDNIVHGGSLYVPYDALAEAMESVSHVSDGGKEVVINYKDKPLIFTAGRLKAVYGGQNKNMSVAPEFKDGKLYIPVKALASVLGLQINYYKDSKSVNISY